MKFSILLFLLLAAFCATSSFTPMWDFVLKTYLLYHAQNLKKSSLLHIKLCRYKCHIFKLWKIPMQYILYTFPDISFSVPQFWFLIQRDINHSSKTKLCSFCTQSAQCAASQFIMRHLKKKKNKWDQNYVPKFVPHKRPEKILWQYYCIHYQVKFQLLGIFLQS